MNLNYSNWPTSGASIASGSGASPKDAAAKASASTPGTPLPFSTAAQDSSQSDSKRIREMSKALARLRETFSTKAMIKQAASDRATMLKNLLVLMRRSLTGASPAEAKSIMAELKSIARELASLGTMVSGEAGEAAAKVAPVVNATEDAGTNDAGGTDPAAVETIENSPDDAAAALSPDITDAGASAPRTNAANGTAATEATALRESGATSAAATPQPRRGRQAAAAYAAQDRQKAGSSRRASGGNSAEKEANESLRKALDAALKALRSVISALRHKLGAANNGLKEAESMAEALDRALAQAKNPQAIATQGPSEDQAQELEQTREQPQEQAAGPAAQDSGAADIPTGLSTDAAGGSSGEASAADVSVPEALGSSINVTA